MVKKTVLLIDASVNLLLGILLLAFSPFIINFLGIPSSDNYFYPNILGGVFVGITVALIIEAFRNNLSGNSAGLGLTGAISINLCGGIVLLVWLLSGNLHIPLKGLIILWTLDIILLLISSAELIISFVKKT
jgi:hypothetical protein